jgi:O-antigen ligase
MGSFNVLQVADDRVTLALLAALVLLVGLPCLLLAVWKITRPPFRVGSFRWLYVAWACALAASSVWNLSRDVRLSVDEAGADNFVRLGFLALGALIILFIGAKYRFIFLGELVAGVLGIFSIFALWGLSSTLWSVSPAGTFYKASEYSVMLGLFALAASLITSEFRDSRKQLLALKGVFDFNWLLIFLLLINVYVGLLVLPDYTILHDYRDEVSVLGFSIQSALPGISENGVGQLAAILGIVALVRLLFQPKSKLVFAPVLAFCLATAALTQSRSPLVAFLVAAVVVLVIARRYSLLALFGGLLAVGVLTKYGQLLLEFLKRGQNMADIASLTGRVGYWEASLQAVRDRWLNGYGAYAGGRYVLESALGVDDVSTVHSAYVEVLLDTGIVGLVILLVGLGATGLWLFRVRSHLVGDPVGRVLWFESMGVFVVLGFRSVFSVSTFVWSFQVLSFGVILIFISVVRRQVARSRNAGTTPAQPLSAARRRRPSLRR